MFEHLPHPNRRLAAIVAAVALAGFLLPAFWLTPQFESPRFPDGEVRARLFAFEDCGPWARILRQSASPIHGYRLKIVEQCALIKRVDVRSFADYANDGEVAVILDSTLPWGGATQEFRKSSRRRYVMWINPKTWNHLTLPIEMGHLLFGTTSVRVSPEWRGIADIYMHLLFLDAYSLAGVYWPLLLAVLLAGAYYFLRRITRE
jgi:hypothetical protein